jgi:hypothetical protein
MNMLKRWYLPLTILFFFCIENSYAQKEIHLPFNCEKSLEFLENNCYYCENNLDSAICKVDQFNFLGEIHGRYFYAGVYHISNSNSGLLANYYAYDKIFILIFEGKGKNKNLKPIHILSPSESYSYYNSPSFELVNSKYGIIIHIYLDSGNGHWDEGEYIIFRNGSWHVMEIPDFYNLFISIIPKGAWFCKGGKIDLEEMTVSFDVYKEDDPCCCPTGGIVIAKLKVSKDNKFVIGKCQYLPNYK